MLDFKSLKSNSISLEKLTEKAQEAAGGFPVDDRFWYPNLGKDGNGYSQIRFLPEPAADGEGSVPWIKYFRHSFQDPVTEKWYIENCLTSVGKKDPVTDYNDKLWKTGDEANKDIARRQKRTPTYISNIYIINDSINPEFNGTVKLFRYGGRIFDKITGVMAPKYPDQIPFNPFNLWTGANFNMRIKTVEGRRNYDDSSFGVTGPLFEDDAKMEKVWLQAQSLQQFLDPKDAKLYPPYEELQKKFYAVIGLETDGETPSDEAVVKRAADSVATPVNPETKEKQDQAIATLLGDSKPASSPVATTQTNKDASPPWDDELAELQKLANS